MEIIIIIIASFKMLNEISACVGVFAKTGTLKQPVGDLSDTITAGTRCFSSADVFPLDSHANSAVLKVIIVVTLEKCPRTTLRSLLL